MQQGVYIAEFEKVLFKRNFAISNDSLSILVNQMKFSKLGEFPEERRFGFYEALADSIAPPGILPERGVEGGIQILGETDAGYILQGMSDQAARHSFAVSWIRDIWCQVYIAGCP
ncbi:MAG TPA: hypothetical protein VEK73_11010 [Xanthobacteraceae bacterium]|nr:hypothetical protein [Xanthobacteraceae bacterium]